MHKDTEIYNFIWSLVMRQYKSVYQHLPLNHHDFEDFAQEAATTILRKKSMIKTRMRFEPYVKKAMKNLFQNYLRDRHYFNRDTKRSVIDASINKFTQKFATTETSDGEIIYTPDIIEEHSYIETSIPELIKMSKDFTSFENAVFIGMAVNGKKLMEISEDSKINYQTLASAKKRVIAKSKKYLKDLLNA